MERSALIPSICPYCGVGCGLYLEVADETVVGLEYMRDHPTNEGALCPKGNASLGFVYHRDRLHYPMVKVKGEFERTSWSEALFFIANNLKRIRTQRGPDALGFLASAKCTNEENYLLQKLARVLGTNNIDHCARL